MVLFDSHCWKDSKSSTTDYSETSSPGGLLLSFFALLLSCLIEFTVEEANLVPVERPDGGEGDGGDRGDGGYGNV